MSGVRRTKLTREQGFALVHAFKQSKLKASVFCQQRETRRHVLAYWISVIGKHQQHAAQGGRLIPVKLPTTTQPWVSSPLRVSLPTGITVEIAGGVDKATLTQLLEACVDVVNRQS